MTFLLQTAVLGANAGFADRCRTVSRCWPYLAGVPALVRSCCRDRMEMLFSKLSAADSCSFSCGITCPVFAKAISHFRYTGTQDKTKTKIGIRKEGSSRRVRCGGSYNMFYISSLLSPYKPQRRSYIRLRLHARMDLIAVNGEAASHAHPCDGERRLHLQWDGMYVLFNNYGPLMGYIFI